MKPIWIFLFPLFLVACWESKIKSFEDLKESYEKHHAQKSVEGLMSLVSKSQSFEEQRPSFEMSFREDVTRPIKSIELLPLGTDPLVYQQKGRTYRPHFSPKGRMKISFAVENDITASSYLVGENDGQWWIVSAETEPNPQ